MLRKIASNNVTQEIIETLLMCVGVATNKGFSSFVVHIVNSNYKTDVAWVDP